MNILFHSTLSVGDDFLRNKAIILNPVTTTHLVRLLGSVLAQGHTGGLKTTVRTNVGNDQILQRCGAYVGWNHRVYISQKRCGVARGPRTPRHAHHFI